MSPRSSPWRALFISDVHMGTRACNADALFEFLSQHHYQKLYLVGDIIDFEQMHRRTHWPQRHNDIVALVMARAKQGVEVIYIPGNHDAILRDYIGEVFGAIKIQLDAEYVTATQKRLWICHGDIFDGAVKYPKLWRFFGDQLNELLLKLNALLNRARRPLHLPYWSLSTYIKTHLAKANAYIQRYQHAAVHESQKRGYDGVICGHIHYAAQIQRDDFIYLNDGDWVESCSAVVETHDGELQLLHYHELLPQQNLINLPQRHAA